jgi:hypothetical protein
MPNPLKYRFYFTGASCRQRDVLETAVVNRNTNGIVCWPMTLTTTVKEFSWTGSFSHPAVYVAAHLYLATNDK